MARNQTYCWAPFIMRSQTPPPSSYPEYVQWGQTIAGQGVHVSVVCVRSNPRINPLSKIYFANNCSLADTSFFLFLETR